METIAKPYACTETRRTQAARCPRVQQCPLTTGDDL